MSKLNAIILSVFLLRKLNGSNFKDGHHVVPLTHGFEFSYYISNNKCLEYWKKKFSITKYVIQIYFNQLAKGMLSEKLHKSIENLNRSFKNVRIIAFLPSTNIFFSIENIFNFTVLICSLFTSVCLLV